MITGYDGFNVGDTVQLRHKDDGRHGIRGWIDPKMEGSIGVIVRACEDRGFVVVNVPAIEKQYVIHTKHLQHINAQTITPEERKEKEILALFERMIKLMAETREVMLKIAGGLKDE